MINDASRHIADVKTEKLDHPIINSDRATAVREDGKAATAKGKSPADAARKAAEKVTQK
jgi:hypothetical protein